MTASDHAISEHVVIKCPACGACESADAAGLADRQLIVCRECGETWPVRNHWPRRRRKVIRRRKAPAVIDAEKRALVTYSDSKENAWKAKMEGDRWPEPPRQRRLPMTAAAVASVFFLGAFVGAREEAVTALPDLAGLYAAVGLPVNLEGLAIEEVGAERALTFEGNRIEVRAMLRNLGAGERTIPPLVAVLSDGAEEIASFRIDPPATTIAPGQSLAILADLGAAPDAAAEVSVRFPRRGETLPAAAAQLAPE